MCNSMVRTKIKSKRVVVVVDGCRTKQQQEQKQHRQSSSSFSSRFAPSAAPVLKQEGQQQTQYHQGLVRNDPSRPTPVGNPSSKQMAPTVSTRNIVWSNESSSSSSGSGRSSASWSDDHSTEMVNLLEEHMINRRRDHDLSSTKKMLEALQRAVPCMTTVDRQRYTEKIIALSASTLNDLSSTPPRSRMMLLLAPTALNCPSLFAPSDDTITTTTAAAGITSTACTPPPPMSSGGGIQQEVVYHHPFQQQPQQDDDIDFDILGDIGDIEDIDSIFGSSEDGDGDLFSVISTITL